MLTKENISRFKPTEVKSKKGYYLVPNFSKYAINVEDVCINLNTGEKVKWVIHGGYYKISAVNDYGTSSLFSLHRTKAILFKDPPPGFERMHVNHINGKRKCNDLDNLEWVTPKRNKGHSLELKEELYGIPVQAYDTKDKKVIEASNMYKLAKIVGVHATSILRYLERDEFVTCTKGYLYRYKDDDAREWKNGVIRGTLRNSSKAVLVYDTVNRKYKIYSSIGQCAKDLGLESKQVSKLCSKCNDAPTKNHIFRLKTLPDILDHDWPSFSDQEVTALKDESRTYYLYKITNGKEIKIFTKLAEAAKYMGIGKQSLMDAVCGGNFNNFKGFNIEIRNLR